MLSFGGILDAVLKAVQLEYSKHQYLSLLFIEN
jgi:hypothetical protein